MKGSACVELMKTGKYLSSWRVKPRRNSAAEGLGVRSLPSPEPEQGAASSHRDQPGSEGGGGEKPAVPESGGAAGDLLFNRQPGSAKRGRPLKRLLPKAAFKRAFTINLLFHICEGELKPAPRRLSPWLCAAGGARTWRSVFSTFKQTAWPVQ